MLFTQKIRQLRETMQLPQRQLAASLGIDTATYSKIEKGDRHAKRNQVVFLARLLHTSQEELLSLWLADQVITLLAPEINLAGKTLEIVNQNLNPQIIRDHSYEKK